MWFDDEGFVLSPPLEIPHVVGQAVVLAREHPRARYKAELILVQFTKPVG